MSRRHYRDFDRFFFSRIGIHGGKTRMLSYSELWTGFSLNEKTQLLEMEGKTASLIFTEGENNRLITDKMKVTVNGWMVEIGKGVEEDGELPEG